MRSTRLQLLSSNINTYIGVLPLSQEIFNWAATVSDEWSNQVSTAHVERGEKDVAFETEQRLSRDLREYFTKAKQLLVSMINSSGLGDDVLEEYGFNEPVPVKRALILKAVDQVKTTNDRLRAEGDPRVLPENIVNTLVEKAEAVEASWHEAQKQSQESIQAHKVLREMYDNGTKKLRYIYHAAVLVLGKYSHDLGTLGFAKAKKRRGRGRPEPPANLTYDWQEPVLNFSWEAPERTTSYQFVYSENEKDWTSLYFGKEPSYSYEPQAGKRYYRVRARNKRGYSDWSEIVQFEPSEIPE